MFSHLFKLIWNKKKSHILLLVEIVASFLVLFGVTSLIVYNLRNYSQPIGFSYQNIWVLNFDSRGQSDSAASPVMQQLKARIQAYPQVESASLVGDNTPYSQNMNQTNVSYNKVSIHTNNYTMDIDAARTLNIPLREGRWFSKADDVEGVQSVVINQPLKEKLFGSGNAVGKAINYDGDKVKYRIVGVIGNFKGKGEYTENTNAVFGFAKSQSVNWLRAILVKVKPGTDATFEARLTRELSAMTKDWNLEVSYMENQRKTTHNITLVPITIFLVVSAFLLINVGLGLFGVLNLSIARRRSEIGLRRALGATAKGISMQFLGEIWVLASFSLIIGLLFAGQFPLLNVFDLEAGVYLTAIAISVLVIYGIVTICALFPSWQAARIQPATALHDE